MASPKLQQWLYLELVMKSMADGASTTYYLSNRPIIDDTNTSRYVPILDSVGSLGTRLNEHTPQATTTSVSLINEPGSFGYERRFSDLFERETPIAQSAKLYVAQTELTDLNVTADFTLAWNATVLGVTFDNERVGIRISTVGVPARDLGKTVTATDFASAPTKSIGQILPVVFGSSVQVKPVQIAAEADGSPEYAYATTYSTTFPVGGVQTYYAKTKEGNYVSVASASNVDTAMLGTAPVAGKNSNPWDNQSICAKPFTTTTGAIITHFSLRIYRATTAVETGHYNFEIRKADLSQNVQPYNAPGTVMGKGSFDLGTLSTAIGEYDIGGTFDSAVVLEPSKNYYFVFWFSASGGTCSNSPVHRYYDTAVSEEGYCLIYDPVGATQGTWDYEDIARTPSAKYRKRMYWTLYGVRFIDTVSSAANSAGWGHAYFEATQKAAGTNYTNPDLTKLDLIVSIAGLKDDGSGTLTGVAATSLNKPLYAVKLLDREWNGSSWVAGRFNFSKYSATHGPISTGGTAYDRTLSAKTTNKQTLISFLEQICRNSACRISTHNNSATPLALYAWGTNTASTATISDEEGEVVSVELAGVESIINRPTILYNLSLIHNNFDKVVSQGSTNNLVSSVDYYNGQNAYQTALLSLSETLYGVRQLGDINFPHVADSTTATSLAEYYVRGFRSPVRMVQIEVPYFKYSSVDLLDVVTLTHPDLPSYFGTTSNATLPTYTGTAVEILEGDYLKRASAYRAQIEGREIVFNSDSIAKIRFTARLLTNYPVDPT